MERHVIVPTDLDKLDSSRDRRGACVGMSRAKNAMFILGIPSFLQLVIAKE